MAEKIDAKISRRSTSPDSGLKRKDLEIRRDNANLIATNFLRHQISRGTSEMFS